MAAAGKPKSRTRGRRTSPPRPTPERPRARFITVDAAAEMLSLHPMSVRKMISRGEIPSARFGRSVRVDLRKLEAQLEVQAQGKRT